MKTRVIYSTLILFPLFGQGITNTLFAQSADNHASKFAKFITAEDARKHLTILASDEYEGRETGKEGQKKAAKYIAENFKKIGLKPATDSTYLQKFPLSLSVPDSSEVKVNEKKYEAFKDFYIFPYGKNLKLEAKNILFLGYGISHDKYDDYKDKDVKDKIVFVLGGEPMVSDSVSLLTGTKEFSEWTTDYTKKAEFAESKGVRAIIILNNKFDATVQRFRHYFESPSMKLLSENKDEKKKIPQLGVSLKMADEILSANNLTVDGVKKQIREAKAPVSFEIRAPFTLTIKNQENKIGSENVLGMIEGTELKDEYVFITAHYDHLGMHDGKVFNGADDDGSGTTGVLELANAFEK
ncbi:MAG TPA: M28 family peptidase, partial [Bacteroidia bacterium]